MSRAWFALVPGAVSVSLSLSACGGGNTASKLVSPPTFEPEGQTKCGVTKSRERPLIVEWPSPDRQVLEDTIRSGVAIVSYKGCEMRVLDRCTAPSKYGYTGLTRAVDKVVIKDEDELYANLPVGAAKLAGQLERSGQLTVGMNLVGRYRADKQTVRADELQGDCAGATHFVYGITVGAFDFYAGGEAKVSGGVGVGSAGAGGKSESARETIAQDGDLGACEKSAPDDKAPPAQCGALIRIEVVALGEAKAAAPTCPDATTWDGKQCVGTKVVTNVQCPAGTTWDGNTCAGSAPASPAPTLSNGRAAETFVNGRLPPEVIQRIVRDNFGRFRLCYENGLSRDPTLTGKISVKFVIDRSGAATQVSIAASTMPDASVVACVQRGFSILSFPQPEGGIVTVVYPIEFAPGK